MTIAVFIGLYGWSQLVLRPYGLKFTIPTDEVTLFFSCPQNRATTCAQRAKRACTRHGGCCSTCSTCTASRSTSRPCRSSPSRTTPPPAPPQPAPAAPPLEHPSPHQRYVTTPSSHHQTCIHRLESEAS